MAQERTITPGYVVIYPNRDKAASKTSKAIVVLILIVSVVLMLIVTVGGWSKLAGMKPVNLIWCLLYLIVAFFIATRWARGLLPLAAALGMLLLIIAIVAGTGVSGTSWFARSHFGYSAAQSLFGGAGLGANVLGFFTLLLVPVQLLLIFFSLQAFGQEWNIELEVPEDEAKRRGQAPRGRPPPEPAAA